MKNKLKQIAASILTLALLAVPVLAAAESVGSNSLNVADGTVYTYSTQAVTSDSGKQTNLHENIFTYKKEAQVRPVVAFGTTLYGTSPMNKTIKTLEEQGYSMVAGINGSFFDRSTGIPYGIVITNSILRSGGSANAVGFLSDGSALIGHDGAERRAPVFAGLRHPHQEYHRWLSRHRPPGRFPRGRTASRAVADR